MKIPGPEVARDAVDAVRGVVAGCAAGRGELEVVDAGPGPGVLVDHHVVGGVRRNTGNRLLGSGADVNDVVAGSELITISEYGIERVRGPVDRIGVGGEA